MALSPIDHVEKGVDRLTYKLKRENIEKLFTIFLEKSQEIEDSYIELANQKSIDIAEGVWLDYIGKIVGVPRKGLTDEEYRAEIRFKISVNTSDGTPNILISLVKQFTKSVNVTLSESGIAFGTISFNGQDNTGSELYNLVQEIRPAGTRWLLHSDFFDKAFLMAYESKTLLSDVFQTTEDGITFENFEVTMDGVNFTPLFTVVDVPSYHPPSLKGERNRFYFEGLDVFQVTNDGIDYEDFLMNTPYSPPSTPPEFKVFMPPNENERPLHWEVSENSLPITT